MVSQPCTGEGREGGRGGRGGSRAGKVGGKATKGIWSSLHSYLSTSSTLFPLSPSLPPSLPLSRAVHREGTKCLQLLLTPDRTYFKDHKGRTVLHHVAEAGSIAAGELVLGLRADAVHDLDRMVRRGQERRGGEGDMEQ